MAFYIVKTKDGSFANRDLISFIESKGDFAIMQEAMDGIRPTYRLLDTTLFPLSKEKTDTYVKLGNVQVFDMEEELRNLSPCDGCEESVPVALEQSVLYYKEYSIVRFSSIPFDNKYAVRHRMATIKVGGNLYVVLNHRKNVEKSLVLTAV